MISTFINGLIEIVRSIIIGVSLLLLLFSFFGIVWVLVFWIMLILGHGTAWLGVITGGPLIIDLIMIVAGHFWVVFLVYQMGLNN